MDNNNTDEKPLGQSLDEWTESIMVSARELTKKARQALAEVSGYQAKAQAYDALVARLHALQRHPDYLYETVETGRKSADAGRSPEGAGWVSNPHKGDNGWERFDFTEETYWMRLKEDAEKDPITPWKLPPVTLAPVKRDQLLDMVRERVNPAYMPGEFLDPLKASTVNRPQFNSKPSYLMSQSLVGVSRSDPSGYYAYVSDSQPDDTNPFWLSKQDKTTWSEVSKQSIYASLHLSRCQILIDLKTEVIMLSAYNEHGYPSPWIQWYTNDGLNLDLRELQDQIDTYL